jgi:RNA-binding protein
MNELPTLTGSQRTHLRGLGQLLSDSLRIGRQGPTPALLTELNRQLDTRELIKVRFEAADRDERATMIEKMAADSPCLCVGAVGRTALFFRPHPDVTKRQVLPS